MTRHCVLACCVWLVGAAAGPLPAAQPPKNPPPLRNIRLLTGWSGDEVRAEMRRMAEAVGVTCEHCHVQGDFSSDQKPAKLAARRMIEMTRALNAAAFPDYTPPEGESTLGRVTCYTCHRGAEIPPVSARLGPRER